MTPVNWLVHGACVAERGEAFTHVAGSLFTLKDFSALGYHEPPDTPASTNILCKWNQRGWSARVHLARGVKYGRYQHHIVTALNLPPRCTCEQMAASGKSRAGKRRGKLCQVINCNNYEYDRPDLLFSRFPKSDHKRWVIHLFLILVQQESCYSVMCPLCLG